MQKRFQPINFIGLTLLCFVFAACTKFDTTKLGTDLIPQVDNVKTFSETIDVTTSQGYGGDSTSIIRTDNFALGHISGDPVFGKSTASVYLQLKPTFYPYVFGNPGDTLLALDSVVMCLAYRGTWGDTLALQELEVRKIEDPLFRDSSLRNFNANYTPNTSGVLGSKMVDVTKLKQQVKIANGKDSVSNQIRIKLNPSQYLEKLFFSDTLTNSLNNAFKNDSLFKRFYNGFAVIAKQTTGNGFIYVNPADLKSRLEFHFKRRRNGVVDTVYNSLQFSTGAGFIFPSSYANNIIRNRTGFPAGAPTADLNYIQTNPGAFVNIDIPRLNTFKDTNRIVHRAELIIDQIPFNPATDDLFTTPPYLYVELKDTSAGGQKYKPIYFDLNPGQFYNPDLRTAFYPNDVDFKYFGGTSALKPDPTFGKILQYRINITRYMQQLVTTQKINYQIKLSAPYTLAYPQYNKNFLLYNNPIAFGRVRIGSGTHPTNRMRLVIVYSKI